MCEDCAREEIDRLEKELKAIADYIIPVYTFEGRKYTPIECAMYLRTVAREALGIKDERLS